MGEEDLDFQKSNAPLLVQANPNDNSNQGTGGAKNDAPHGAQQNNNIKIPPTMKDDRKLFVGGLPSDGK